MTITPELFSRAYRLMLEARLLEEKIASLYRSGKIVGGVFLGKGQEALSVALGIHLQQGDIYAPLIRDQAGRLAFGGKDFGDSITETLRTYLGSALGPMRGRDGNIHRGKPKEGYYAMISHLGAMVSTVAGALIARRLRGEKAVVGATCIGDGGTSTGSFHEGLNMAAIEKLPLVVVIANNQYAYSTPNQQQFACDNLLDRAIGYGVEGYEAIGNRLDSTLTVIGEAVARARQGKGPQLVVANLLRLAGHGEHDDANYVSQEALQKEFARDALEVSEKIGVAEGYFSTSEVATWREEIQQEIQQTVASVLQEPKPEAAEESWTACATYLKEPWKEGLPLSVTTTLTN